MDACIFCKIIRGEIKSDKVYEDENILAFLDIRPYSRGHVLVIPKKHSKWLWDMPIEDYSELSEIVHYLANVLRKVFDTDWVEEVVAGAGVHHTHIHLLPRKRDDGLGEVPIKPLSPGLSDKEMNEIAERIKNAV